MKAQDDQKEEKDDDVEASYFVAEVSGKSVLEVFWTSHHEADVALAGVPGSRRYHGGARHVKAQRFFRHHEGSINFRVRRCGERINFVD